MEEIKPGKEVVLSVAVVACSSGLALMPSLVRGSTLSRI